MVELEKQLEEFVADITRAVKSAKKYGRDREGQINIFLGYMNAAGDMALDNNEGTLHPHLNRIYGEFDGLLDIAPMEVEEE